MQSPLTFSSWHCGRRGRVDPQDRRFPARPGPDLKIISGGPLGTGPGWSPTAASKTNDFPGPLGCFWGSGAASSSQFRPIWGVRGVRPEFKICLFNCYQKPATCKVPGKLAQYVRSSLWYSERTEPAPSAQRRPTLKFQFTQMTSGLPEVAALLSHRR